MQQANAQVGWQLDTAFPMPYSPWFVNDFYDNSDGTLFLSGAIHFPEDDVIDPLYHRAIAHVFADGSVDDDFPDFPLTGGLSRALVWHR